MADADKEVNSGTVSPSLPCVMRGSRFSALANHSDENTSHDGIVDNGPPQSRSVLARPRLAVSAPNQSCSMFGTAPNRIGSSVLRPSQLKPTSSNPFVNTEKTDTAASADPNSADTERLKDNGETSEDAPKFVPLGASNVCNVLNANVPVAPVDTNSAASFVFGQNLSARVLCNNAEGKVNGSSEDHTATNGNSESLFSSAPVSDLKDEGSGSAECSEGGLVAAAAEYERARQRPSPLPTCPADTLTGEEGEKNVMQVACRLFAFELSSWRERGRGVLRLNDCAEGGSRIVARASGSLRVLLNTKVWPDMVADRAANKSLRLTATDAQHHVKVFLVMASPADIQHLHQLLRVRISAARQADADASTGAGLDAGAGEGSDKARVGQVSQQAPTNTSADDGDVHKLEAAVEDDPKESQHNTNSLKRKDTIMANDSQDPQDQQDPVCKKACPDGGVAQAGD